MKENENKKANKELQTLLEVIKDLNNPVLVNAYVLVGSPATTRAANNVAAQNDLTQELEKQEATDKTPESSNDPEKIEKNQRYVVL
ncbi:MAG: hypothetical protein LBI53_08385 [Candidatus Peribacteria bacterium]|jgi:hypothetical protein|nr:hypothetical protein [Candidatus Peribacteria bacterium]